MKVFVINLARSVDRRTLIKEKMFKADVEFEFFDAVDITSPQYNIYCHDAPNLTLNRKGYTLLPSELACYTSHYLLWKKCVDMQEPIVILEDNIDLDDNFKSVLQVAFDNINNFNFIKLSATLKGRKFHKIKHLTENYFLGFFNRGTSGAMGYILTPLSAKNLLNNSQEFIFPVDDFMEKPWIHSVQTFSVFPAICFRAKIATTIGSKRKDKSKMNFKNKIYVELYRLYEGIMKKLYWHR